MTRLAVQNDVEHWTAYTNSGPMEGTVSIYNAGQDFVFIETNPIIVKGAYFGTSEGVDRLAGQHGPNSQFITIEDVPVCLEGDVSAGVVEVGDFVVPFDGIRSQRQDFVTSD